MNTSSSMRKFPSRKEMEFTVLLKESESPKSGLPEELESPTPGLPEESESPTPGLPESELLLRLHTVELSLSELESTLRCREGGQATPVQNNFKDRDQPDKKRWSNPEVIGEVLKWCIQIGVTITVLVFQFRGWPQVPDVYITDNPRNTSRGGDTYTCECSLPEDLTANTNLNFCYYRSNLEDVTILTYTSLAAAKIQGIVANFERDKVQEIYTSTVPGYEVSQVAFDLQGSIINRDHVSKDELEPLYMGTFYQKLKNDRVRIDNLQSQSFNFTNFWDDRYVRLYFEYYCDSCFDCGPDAVNHAWSGISNRNDWLVRCFNIRSSLQPTCNQGDAFLVKCVVYPQTTLPPSEKIWELLKKIVELQGSLNISGSGERNESTYTYMTLEYTQLYLKLSTYTSNENHLSFVEVIKNSPLWMSLLTSFPALGEDPECATMPLVQVCDGTYVCDLFRSYHDDTRPYQSRCLDMNNKTQCKQLMTTANGTGESTLDITNSNGHIRLPLNATSWLELECPEFLCNSVHPSFVVHWWDNAVAFGDYFFSDPLSKFLYQWILSDDWEQRGMCTRTYRDVYRYLGATPGANESGTMFFETECTDMNPSWRNPEAKCWLTGRYHNRNDSPTDDWTQLDEGDPRFVNLRKRFVCSGRKKQGFGPWFIATMGILFGWIGTVQLIWTWFAKRIRPWIRKARKLMTSPKD